MPRQDSNSAYPFDFTKYELLDLELSASIHERIQPPSCTDLSNIRVFCRLKAKNVVNPTRFFAVAVKIGSKS